MYNPTILKLLTKMEEAIRLINERTATIQNVNDFLTTPGGVMRRDSVITVLVGLGGAVNSIDKQTKGGYLKIYPSIPWQQIIGMRNVLAHEYFDVDTDIIFKTVKEDIPELSKILTVMKDDMLKEKNIYDSLVTAIINRASDCSAKTFDDETKEKMLNYLAKNAKNTIEKKEIVSTIWKDADVILSENRIEQEWRNDTKEELFELAEGKVRDQSQGWKW